MRSALLLSGGMDSIAIAYWKRPEFTFTVDYGQLAAQAEIEASRSVARELGLHHEVITVPARALGSGDMAGTAPDTHAPASDWWPYRNQFLVTLAAMRAVTLGVTQVLVGTVRGDGQHQDGTRAFVDQLDVLLQLQEGSLRVAAPAIELDTVTLIRSSAVPRELLAWAHSCHKANTPCGQCRGCNKYLQTLHALDESADVAG